MAEVRRVGARLRELRESTRMSQAALARLVGVSPPTITRYEKGQVQINADDLPRIAQILGVHTTAFFDEASEHEPREGALMQLMEDFLAWQSARIGRRGRIVWSNGTVRPEKAVPDALQAPFLKLLPPTPAPPDGILAVA